MRNNRGYQNSKSCDTSQPITEGPPPPEQEEVLIDRAEVDAGESMPLVFVVG